jgi:hypothetical protein
MSFIAAGQFFAFGGGMSIGGGAYVRLAGEATVTYICDTEDGGRVS